MKISQIKPPAFPGQADASYLEGSEQQVKLTWFDVDRQPADKERSYLEQGNA